MNEPDTLQFEAVVFDLDGVVTKTAATHTKAWKNVFDDYLKKRAKKDMKKFREFSTKDYLKYVDGKPRYEGVESFLISRDIHLQWGSPDDKTDVESICGIGNKKNKIFQDILNQQGVEVYDSTLEMIKQLHHAHIKLAIATSSKNGMKILEKAELTSYFKAVVDGVVSAKEQLKGKPEPDIFLKACDLLNADPQLSILVEDAVSGVKAGAKGNFGLTIGIARKENSKELYSHGADHVIADFSEVKDLTELNKLFLKFRRK